MSNILRTPFTIKRLTPGSYVNGLWIEGTSSTFTIMATVQPVSGLEMRELPEGRRNSQAVKFYTDTLLRTSDEANKTNPDILLAFGYQFEVEVVGPWQSNLINHYKCIGYKLREIVSV